MTGRRASLVQADYDRAVSALTKAGLTPKIIFDLTGETVTFTVANEDAAPKSDWQQRAPDRV